jgi:HK97 family phage prohead protease
MNIHGWIAKNNAKNRENEAKMTRKWTFPEENRAKAAPNSTVLTPERAVLAGVERRFTPCQIELRSAKSGSGPGSLVGYAAVFNSLSVDMGGWFEKLLPGAFDGVMRDPQRDCRALFNHRDELILGRESAGTLKLLLEQGGMRFEVDLPDTQTGRDVATSVKRGDITGCSFSFRLATDGAEWDFDGASPLRSVKDILELYDVGPVTHPAYKATSVDARSFQAALEAHQNALQAELIRQQLYHAKARLRLAEASLV